MALRAYFDHIAGEFVEIGTKLGQFIRTGYATPMCWKLWPKCIRNMNDVSHLTYFTHFTGGDSNRSSSSNEIWMGVTEISPGNLTSLELSQDGSLSKKIFYAGVLAS